MGVKSKWRPKVKDRRAWFSPMPIQGKLDDPQGGDKTTLMQQVREVITVNQKMTDESSWI